MPLLVLAVLTVAVYFRADGLGGRSLWADEFCTWRVSRMPAAASLRWGPELTKPPLYQFALRALTDDAHPPEWELRLPAMIAGTLAVAAAGWLVTCHGTKTSALAAITLLALQPLQIAYSQEARPYSLLVLGSIVSVTLWRRLVHRPTMRVGAAYAVVTALSLHAHYLMVLVIAAQLAWWMLARDDRQRIPRTLAPLIPLASAGLLCLPIVAHFLSTRTSTFQGLDWIQPATWSGALQVLEDITFGPLWLLLVLVPAAALWLTAALKTPRVVTSDPAAAPFDAKCPGSARATTQQAAWADAARRPMPPARTDRWASIYDGRSDVVGLLFAWIAGSWFVLLVISWCLHPAMVNRYALSAGIPAIVLPLIVFGRIDPRLPVLLAVAFAPYGAYRWAAERTVVEPGFRELSQYLAEHVDPAQDLIVLTVDLRTHPDWADAERLSFEYYPVRDYPIHELRLLPDGATPQNPELFDDPRSMYLGVLWADPFEILRRVNRRAEPFLLDGDSYSQLLFSPYRLVRVAPK